MNKIVNKLKKIFYNIEGKDRIKREYENFIKTVGEKYEGPNNLNNSRYVVSQECPVGYSMNKGIIIFKEEPNEEEVLYPTPEGNFVIKNTEDFFPSFLTSSDN